MFLIVHLIFKLIKIALLSLLYTSILSLVIKYLHKKTGNTFLGKWEGKHPFSWIVTCLPIGIGLYLYSLSYWGNHGIGDVERIPIGHRHALQRIDGGFPYFTEKISGITQQTIREFALADDIICAEKGRNDKGKYLVFHLEKSSLKEFENLQEYQEYASQYDLPDASVFTDFRSHYHDYWSLWRMLLLP